jgi:hypothetical protein
MDWFLQILPRLHKHFRRVQSQGDLVVLDDYTIWEKGATQIIHDSNATGIVANLKWLPKCLLALISRIDTKGKK